MFIFPTRLLAICGDNSELLRLLQPYYDDYYHIGGGNGEYNPGFNITGFNLKNKSIETITTHEILAVIIKHAI